jgi:hypothetical protein
MTLTWFKGVLLNAAKYKSSGGKMMLSLRSFSTKEQSALKLSVSSSLFNSCFQQEGRLFFITQK